MFIEDRVRAHTSEKINDRLDQRAEQRVRVYGLLGEPYISCRIDELDREWDIERVLEMNAATFAFTGVLLSQIKDRRWLTLSAFVLPFLFQHAVQGWCPPIPVLRRLGFRTREEIDREKYALKALRGDFTGGEQVLAPDEAIIAAAV